jgi:hypothetical protein
MRGPSSARSSASAAAGAVGSVMSTFTAAASATYPSCTRPIFEPSAMTTVRAAAAIMAALTSASGRLMFVTPASASTPLQPISATSA